MEVLSCGHCNFQTQKIRRLELHLKSKHTSTTTKDNDSDAEFIDLEEELFQEIESEIRSNSVEDPDITMKQKNDSTKDTDSPSGTVIPGPKSDSSSTYTQSRNDSGQEFKSLAAYKCNICDFSSDSTRSIGIHKFKSHGFQKRLIVKSSETKCHQCPFVGSSSMSLKVHQHRKGHFPNRESPPKSEVTQKPIPVAPEDKEVRDSSDLSCSKCPFVGSNKDSYKNHLYRAHKNPERPPDGVEQVHCPECVFVGWNRKSLTTHIGRAHRANAAAVLALAWASKMKANCDGKKEPDIKKNSQTNVGGRLEGSKPKVQTKIPTTTATTIPTRSPIQVKTEAADNSFKAEKKPVLPKSEPTEVLDILKGFIRCPACQFMCNSLRSMGEHVAAVHSTSADVKADPTVGDSDKVPSNTKVTSPPSDARSEETAQADSDKSFRCSKCGAVYFRLDSLRRHCKQRHEGQGVRPNPKTHQPLVKEEINSPVRQVPRKSSVHSSIPCPICRTKFSSKTNLKRHHLRFHPDDKEGHVSEAVDPKAVNTDEDLDVEILEG